MTTELNPDATAPNSIDSIDAETAIADLDGIADLLKELSNTTGDPAVSRRALYFLGASIASMARTLRDYAFPNDAGTEGRAAV